MRVNWWWKPIITCFIATCYCSARIFSYFEDFVRTMTLWKHQEFESYMSNDNRCQTALSRTLRKSSRNRIYLMYVQVHESEAHDLMMWYTEKEKNEFELDINRPILTYSKCLIFLLSSLKWTTLFETDTNREWRIVQVSGIQGTQLVGVRSQKYLVLFFNRNRLYS